MTAEQSHATDNLFVPLLASSWCFTSSRLERQGILKKMVAFLPILPVTEYMKGVNEGICPCRHKLSIPTFGML